MHCNYYPKAQEHRNYAQWNAIECREYSIELNDSITKLKAIENKIQIKYCFQFEGD